MKNNHKNVIKMKNNHKNVLKILSRSFIKF